MYFEDHLSDKRYTAAHFLIVFNIICYYTLVSVWIPQGLLFSGLFCTLNNLLVSQELTITMEMLCIYMQPTKNKRYILSVFTNLSH